MTAPSVAHKGGPVKRVVLAVKFWWHGLDPEKAFDLFAAPDVLVEAKAVTPWLREWQGVKPGTTLQEVSDYMLDHDLTVLGSERVGQRRAPGVGWQGLYAVRIGEVVR